MKKIKLLMVLALLSVILLSTLADAHVYFLYDAEKSKILYMGENETAFTEKIDFEKNPDRIMQTGDPNKFLAIYAPEDNSEIKGKKAKESIPGQLIIFNIETGRTEDLVELGFAPFQWTYSKDFQHFYISYKATPGSNSMELLHYYVSEQKTEKLSDFASNIFDLALSNDESKLYVLTDRTVKISKVKKFSDLLTLSCSPLAVINTLSLDKEILNMHILSNDRLVLLNLDRKRKEKSLMLINPENNETIAEQKLKLVQTYYSWHKDERVLIVGDFEFQKSYRGQLCKVTADGIKAINPAKPWFGYEYIPERDCLYLLSRYALEVVDFKNSTQELIETGNNLSSHYYYQLYHIPDSSLLTIYSYEDSMVKFIDLDGNMLLKKVNCGKSGGKKLLASLFSILSETVITTNEEKSRLYILNRATKDITVLDRELNNLDFIAPPEPPIGMCQIKKPVLQTIVTSGTKVYHLDEDSMQFEVVDEFSQPTKETYFYQDGNRLILISDKELAVINTETWQVENKFLIFGDPNEKYTKIQPGSRRYYFIRTL